MGMENRRRLAKAILGEGVLTPISLTTKTLMPTTEDLDESEDNTYTFTLKETARDANEDGVVDADDFTVMVNNSTLKAERTTTESGYFTVTPDDTGAQPGAV